MVEQREREHKSTRAQPTQTDRMATPTTAGAGTFTAASAAPQKNAVTVKVAMLGDAQIGKTSLMVKYV